MTMKCETCDIYIGEMRVSVVVTVLNEKGEMEALFRGLLRQTRRPDEVVMVDGGSVDGTVQEACRWKGVFGGHGVKMEILARQGSNIAEGRNYGVRRAWGEVIAVTDGGCVPERKWLANLVMPIEGGDAEVVAGFYNMRGKKEWQKAAACYLGVVPERLNPKTFLPSSRSVAFTKEVWRRVGGYPEGLSLTAEDTGFNLRLIKAGVRIEAVSTARVRWKLPGSLALVAKKFYFYAKGDAEAGVWWHPVQRWRTHLIKNLSVFWRYLVLFGLWLVDWRAGVLGLVAYGVWIYVKNRTVVKGEAIWWCFPIQAMADFCVMAGVVAGLVAKEQSRLRKWFFG